MRKISAYILIALLLISMMGCSAESESPTAQLPAKFESDFNADYGILKLSGHISKHETGIYTITLTAPKSIEGICFNYVGGKITSSLDNISFDTNDEGLPSTAFVKSIANLLDTASNSGIVNVTKSDGYNRYCLFDNSCILQEQESGSITSLIIESIDISMNFIDFKTS